MLDDSTTGRRTTEIEITPEMIEAAKLALLGYSHDYASWEEGAENILRAGLAESPKVKLV